MEKNDNILDRYIQKELEVKPSPYLSSKVMERIGNRSRRVSIAFNFAMAAVVAAVLVTGIFLGSNYTTRNDKGEQLALNINDTHLENLHLYTIED